MRKTPFAFLFLAILLAGFGSAVRSAGAEEENSLVIGRIMGTTLDYPTMFRDVDLNKAIPDPMVVRHFVLLDRSGEKTWNVYLKPDGFFHAEVPPGPVTLARKRIDRSRSYEPLHFPIIPFVAHTGRISNLGTIAVEPEWPPKETGLSIGRWITVGKFLYHYRYRRTDNHEPVLGVLRTREPELYDRYAGENPENVNTLPPAETDSSEKEFKEVWEKD